MIWIAKCVLTLLAFSQRLITCLNTLKCVYLLSVYSFLVIAWDVWDAWDVLRYLFQHKLQITKEYIRQFGLRHHCIIHNTLFLIFSNFIKWQKKLHFWHNLHSHIHFNHHYGTKYSGFFELLIKYKTCYSIHKSQ